MLGSHIIELKNSHGICFGLHSYGFLGLRLPVVAAFSSLVKILQCLSPKALGVSVRHRSGFSGYDGM